jgi:hypothetical protein
MRRLTLVAAGLGVVLAGGAGVYAVRALGDDGCPSRKDLKHPVTDFTQAPRDYITVTLTNPNACFGFKDEPVEIDLFRADGAQAISYFEQAKGNGPAHSDVGVCCEVTLPPHGTWTIRFGGTRALYLGYEDVVICNIHVQAMKSLGYSVWKRMPDGGRVMGHGSPAPPSFHWHPVPRHANVWPKVCPSGSPAP